MDRREFLTCAGMVAAAVATPALVSTWARDNVDLLAEASDCVVSFVDADNNVLAMGNAKFSTPASKGVIRMDRLDLSVMRAGRAKEFHLVAPELQLRIPVVEGGFHSVAEDGFMTMNMTALSPGETVEVLDVDITAPQ